MKLKNLQMITKIPVITDICEVCLHDYNRGMNQKELFNLVSTKIDMNAKSNECLWYLSWIGISYTLWKYNIQFESFLSVLKDQVLHFDMHKCIVTESLDLSDCVDEIKNEIKYILSESNSNPSKLKPFVLTNNSWNKWDVYCIELDQELVDDEQYYGKWILFQKVDEFPFLNDILPVVYSKICDSSSIPTTIEEYNKLEYIQIFSNFYDERLFPFDGRKSIVEQLKEKETKNYPTDEFGYLPIYRIAIWKIKKNYPTKLHYLSNFPQPVLPANEYIHNDGKETTFYLWMGLYNQLIMLYKNYNLRMNKIYGSDFQRRVTSMDLIDVMKKVNKLK